MAHKILDEVRRPSSARGTNPREGSLGLALYPEEGPTAKRC